MYVKVLVVPSSKRASLTADSKSKLRIAVTEPAELNAANRRVIELVAAHYDVSRTRVRIISGHHSPSKMLSVGTD